MYGLTSGSLLRLSRSDPIRQIQNDPSNRVRGRAGVVFSFHSSNPRKETEMACKPKRPPGGRKTVKVKPHVRRPPRK